MLIILSDLASGTFGFIVEGNRYDVHRGLISRTSTTLEMIMKQHNDQEYADLEGVDKATFDRFLQWIYSGYYTVLECTSSSHHPSGHFQTSFAKKVPNFMNIIMAHIKLYVFAEENDIGQLKVTASGLLQSQFVHRAKYIHAQQADDIWFLDIMTVFRYVYRHTSKSSAMYGISPRQILIHEAFEEIIPVAQTEEFQLICVENPELVGDILAEFKIQARQMMSTTSWGEGEDSGW